MNLIKKDLELYSENIKNNGFFSKKMFGIFLKDIIIENNLSINDLIITKIWDIEKNIKENSNYTYWFSGGISWQEIYSKDLNYTEEEELSISIGYNDIQYIYINSKDAENKIKILYNIIKNIKEILKININLDTEIICTNFICNENETDENKKFIFDYISNRSFYKEPYFNIKLIIINTKDIIGGSKIKNNRKKTKNYKLIKNFMSIILQNQNRYISPEEKINIINYIKINDFNNKSLFEINIECYRKSSNFTIDNLKLFNKTYLLKSLINTDENENENIIIIKSKINKLNELGLLTYSFLSKTNKIQEMGLNIDDYRQKIFFKTNLKNNNNNISEYLKKINENYKKVFKEGTLNNYFIEKISDLITIYSIDGYDIFIDFIEKWFISIFRPAINSFIIEINKELYNKYNIILFIAGGDAMRRYDNNISFTKDIDTKLFIGQINKEEIFKIVAKHIVKLRNYLEENFINFLTIDTIEYNKEGEKILKRINYSNETINFYYINKKGEAYEYNINLKIKNNIPPQQQFRVREIKKSNLFPVDLYSIDFQTVITSKNILYPNDISIKKINISLLDVVIQEEIFETNLYTIVDNIPVSSLEYLIKDLEKTYSIPDRALARIFSGKYKKDIIRYNRLYELYENKIKRNDNKENIKKLLVISDIEYDKLRDMIEKNTLINDDIKLKFYIFLYKLQNNLNFNIFDILITSKIIFYINYFNTFEKYNEIFKIAYDIANFKINIFNENLNKYLNEYFDYKEKDEISKIYLELFNYLITKKDNQQKHIIPFLNSMIKQEITKANLNKTIPQIKKQKKSNLGIINPKITKIQQPSISTRSGRISKKTDIYIPDNK